MPKPILYHGTSETIARAILDEGCLRPGATEPVANPAYVYLIDPAFHAIVFGYARAMRIQSAKFDFDTQPFIKGRTYDHVVVFEVKTGALNKSLFRRSRLFRGETAYKGVIPGRALGRMLKLPVTRKLADFVKSWAKD